MAQYYLFGTEGCHLCEQALAIIFDNPQALDVEVKDIIEKQAWLDQFSIRIPVLQHIASGQELDWPFDDQTLKQFINEAH